MGSYSFRTDFRVLSLGNFDAILGMDWLEAYSPMQVHWALKWLAIPYDGQTQVLQGLLPDEPKQLLLQIENTVPVLSSYHDAINVPAPIS